MAIQKIVTILALLIAMSCPLFAQEKPKNEIKSKIKIIDNNNIVYTFMYYRNLFKNNKIGIGYEYSDKYFSRNTKSVIVEYSIKF